MVKTRIVVVCEDDEGRYSGQVNDFLSKGGTLLSCSSGVLDTEAYNFPSWFHAILEVPYEESEAK